jgi:hypothetical protein
MSAAAGPFMIAAALLLLGGALKAARPSDTAKALRGVGLPASTSLVRVGGVVEVAIGFYAIIDGGVLAAVLVGASYLAFAAFVARALSLDAPIATCGCFGKEDTPPSVVHIGINVAAVAAAIAVIAQPGVGMADVVRAQPLGAAPFLLLVLVGAYATFVALTALPRTLAVVRVVARDE